MSLDEKLALLGRGRCRIWPCSRQAEYIGVCWPCYIQTQMYGVTVEQAVQWSHEIAEEEFEDYLEEREEAKQREFEEFYGKRELESNTTLAALDEAAGAIPKLLKRDWDKATNWEPE